MMTLVKYKKKRDFSKTNEPVGKIEKSVKNRFVIQFHHARSRHYDLRLEHGGVLISFAVPKGLSQNPKHKRLAVHVEDHPVDYISFEGIIPKGNYGAGTVEIFDQGTYLPLCDFDKAIKDGHIKFVLQGKKLKGEWVMVKTKDNNWLIKKSDDEFATAKTVMSKLPFKKTDFQLATLKKKIPTGKDWIYEIKYDGYRIMSFVENGNVKMLTRGGQNYTKKFPLIKKSLLDIEQENFVVDGEIVVFDEFGKSDFGLLQNALKQGQNNFVYVVFDLLAKNGQDLRDQSLLKRKEILERLLHLASNVLMFSSHVQDGQKTFDFAKQNNLEGIVAKKTHSSYMGGRTEDWIKIKCVLRQEFVIAGFTTSTKNQVISALLLGVYQFNDLIFVGKVGTGLSESIKEKLIKKFTKSKICPFKIQPKEKNCVWVEPKLVAEIQFAEVTKDGVLRQASFVGLRVDKKAKGVCWEVIDAT